MSASLSALLSSSAQATAPSRDPGGASAKDDSTTLAQVVRWFEDWVYATQDERQLASRDRDYVDHKQLTADIMKTLAARRQPDLVINRVVRKVDYLMGMERRLRSDPKAFPRNPIDEPESDTATQVLRYIADDNSYDQIRSSVWDNMLVEGIGGSETVCENRDGKVDIRCHHIPWNRMWWDPHSARLNFNDARYMGSMTWMDRDEAEDAYPKATDAIADTLSCEESWGSFADTPRLMMWADTRRSRVLVAQIHYKEHGDWFTATFTRSGFLIPPVKSPYLDRKGKTRSPQRMRAYKVDRDNHHYGAVRQYISMQDEINARRSKALHLLNTRQVKADNGAVDDVDKARREVAKPDGWIDVNPGFGFEILPTGDMASGQFELLRHVSEEFDATGPNAAMAGKDPREQSGRAIQAQQQGGAVENEPAIDGLRQFNRENYQDWWMCAKQWWTDEMTIAVTNDEDDTKWVTLNHPVTVAEELANMAPDQRAMMMQQQGIQPGDPRLQQVIRTENNISDLDVRIDVEDGPDISTLQSEQFNFLQGRQDVPLNLLIKYSALPKKAEMLKDLEAIQAQNAQQAAAQQAHELAMQQAKIGLLQAQAQLATAGAAEKQAGAVDRVHGMAIDHAYITAPDHAPPGHEMALASVAGSPVPVAPPPMPTPQLGDVPGPPSNAPLPPPDLSAIPQRPALPPS